MGIRAIAEADLASTLEDGEFGYGWPITLTAPGGFVSQEQIMGQQGDISQAIDPDTGQLVSGRQAHVGLRISSIVAAGYPGLPKGIENAASKPWLISFTDLQNKPQVFKISEANPDRTLGIIMCQLEVWEP